MIWMFDTLGLSPALKLDTLAYIFWVLKVCLWERLCAFQIADLQTSEVLQI